jgi:hypothetical protein
MVRRPLRLSLSACNANRGYVDLTNSLSRGQPSNLQSQGAQSSSQSYQLRQVEYDDDESVLSDETVSDLPGPGRLLDKLYQKGGRALERAANRLAQKYMSNVSVKPESGNEWPDQDDMGNGAVAIVSKGEKFFIPRKDPSTPQIFATGRQRRTIH